MISEAPVNLRLARDLDAVTELVARGPCIGAAARDADGHTIRVDAPEAVCFCPMGAAMRVTRSHGDGDYRYMDVLDALHYELGMFTAISMWADRHSHADVVALCRRAALRARGVL